MDNKINIPIPSYGLIAFYKKEGEIKFCIYQRRDTYEYMDFLRGMWTNKKQLFSLFSYMTPEEKQRIRTHVFQELWDDLWVDHENTRVYKDNFSKCMQRFELTRCMIPELISSTPCYNQEPTWGFPKGKRNVEDEDEIECALREFEEETKISTEELRIIPDLFFEEIYKGSNNRVYTTKYFVGESQKMVIPERIETPNCKIRKTCISDEANDIKWVNIEESEKYLDKRMVDILKQVKKYLTLNS